MEDKHAERVTSPQTSDSSITQSPAPTTTWSGREDVPSRYKQRTNNEQFPDHTTPVGGRIQDFIHEWEKITSDKWIMNIIKHGYCLELQKQPPNRRPRDRAHSAKELTLLQLEAQELLRKKAIEVVPHNQRQRGVYSNYFLVPKVDETLRPILDLRFLNKFIKTQKFKMTSLQEVIPQLQRGDFMATIDLKDAYLHIPINHKHKHLLRFVIHQNHYQFTVLAFGPNSASRVFTKCLATVAEHLCRQEIHVYPYLDDWLVKASSYRECKHHIQQDILTLSVLGFSIHWEKSSMEPEQIKIFLGAEINTIQAKVFPSNKRTQAILRETHHYQKGQVLTVRTVSKHMGMMASCIHLAPNVRLHMRPFQEWLQQQWSQATGSWEDLVVVTHAVQQEIAWWNKENIAQGKHFSQPTPSVTITTDASQLGWGAHRNKLKVRGLWSPQDAIKHINYLELKTVFLALKAFQKELYGNRVLIQTDNTTTMFYINKQGGTHSLQLSQLAQEIWRWAIPLQINLLAIHLPGKNNIEADRLSRQTSASHEWELNQQETQRVFQKWETPQIDLFATHQNAKCQHFASRQKEPQSQGNAL